VRGAAPVILLGAVPLRSKAAEPNPMCAPALRTLACCFLQAVRAHMLVAGADATLTVTAHGSPHSCRYTAPSTSSSLPSEALTVLLVPYPCQTRAEQGLFGCSP